MKVEVGYGARVEVIEIMIISRERTEIPTLVGAGVGVQAGVVVEVGVWVIKE